MGPATGSGAAAVNTGGIAGTRPFPIFPFSRHVEIGCITEADLLRHWAVGFSL
jgi:hypothetical protein